MVQSMVGGASATVWKERKVQLWCHHCQRRGGGVVLSLCPLKLVDDVLPDMDRRNARWTFAPAGILFKHGNRCWFGMCNVDSFDCTSRMSVMLCIYIHLTWYHKANLNG